jgi:hypothetical protein
MRQWAGFLDPARRWSLRPQAEAIVQLVLLKTSPQQRFSAQSKLLLRMALHLAESQHVIIDDIIASKVPFKAKQIANVAGCDGTYGMLFNKGEGSSVDCTNRRY